MSYCYYELLACLFQCAAFIQRAPKIPVSLGVIAVSQFERGLEFVYRLLELPATIKNQAQIVIETLEPLAGDLPERALRLVREWAELHRGELEANWARAEAHEPLDTIEPLP